MSLSTQEIIDVNVAWREIKDGKVKRFTNVKALLKELKT